MKDWFKKEKPTWFYILVGVLLVAAKPVIADVIFVWVVRLFTEDLSDDVYAWGFTAFEILVCGFLAWHSFRSKKYKETTGRDLAEDQSRYHRRATELEHYLKDYDRNALDKDSLPEAKIDEVSGIIFGSVDDGSRLLMRKTDGEGNICLAGRPGDGKTSCVILPTALRFGGSVFGLDAKSDITPIVAQEREKILIFDPSDPTSCHFDPFAGIETMSLTERRSRIENLGVYAVPSETGENSKFWDTGARTFWAGVSLYLLDKDPAISFMDVVQQIPRHFYKYWVDKAIEDNCEIALEYLGSYSEGNEKNHGSVYGHLVECIRPFLNGALPILLDKDDGCTMFSPEMLDQGYDLWIRIPQDSLQIYAPISSMIISVFMSYFMGRSDKASGQRVRDILIALDEFPLLHFDFDTISIALSTLRSKRVSVLYSIQSIGQTDKLYGREGTRVLIDNCSYIAVMSAQDPDSRKFFQELVGHHKELKTTETITKTDKTTSHGFSYTLEDEMIYQPEDFGNLGDKIVVVANGQHIEVDKVPYYEAESYKKYKQTDNSKIVLPKELRADFSPSIKTGYPLLDDNPDFRRVRIAKKS